MKYGILIDDFAIFHDGYLDLIEEAIKSTDKLLIFIRASECSTDIKHPFTAEEREEMICSVLYEKYPKVDARIFHLPDMVYEPLKWVHNLDDIIKKNVKSDSSVVIFDCNNSNELKCLNYSIVNFKLPRSTQSVLEHIYESDIFSFSFFREFMPDPAVDCITSFLDDERVDSLLNEFKFVQEYRKAWENVPYPPVFVTVDSLVVCRNDVLVIRRGNDPGKGKIALPGGFINQDEFIKDACIRELIEETSISLSKNELNDAICD